MCLGVPGKIIEIYEDQKTRMGKVDFDGVTLEVCLEAVPEADIHDFVIVHAGFAISRLSEDEAAETLRYLKEIDEINQQFLSEDA
jgi:hydrogenase expression/formation protein HypC